MSAGEGEGEGEGDSEDNKRKKEEECLVSSPGPFPDFQCYMLSLGMRLVTKG